MTKKGKLLLLVIATMILIGGGSRVYDLIVCKTTRGKTQNKIDYLQKTGSVKAVELLNKRTGYETNLIGHSILVTDSVTVEEIRKMIVQKSRTTMNHPTAKWSVLLKVTTDNNESLDFEVSKISNDRDSSMTHLYFQCDSYTSSSLTLGNYLERLTEYKGKNYY